MTQGSEHFEQGRLVGVAPTITWGADGKPRLESISFVPLGAQADPNCVAWVPERVLAEAERAAE